MYSFKTCGGVVVRSMSMLLILAVVTSLCCGLARAAVPGITGGAKTPTFNLVASAGSTSQPDGASIYTWGYGCGKAGGTPGTSIAVAPAGFAPAALASISTCPIMQLPGPTLIVTEGDRVTVNLV